MKLQKKVLTNLLIPALLVATIVVFAYLLRSLELEAITNAIKEQGALGWFIFIFFISVSVVFSPVNALIIMPIALISYGYFLAASLTFLGNIIGGTLNFYIARKFGRPIVEKIVGEKLIEKVDEFTEVAGWKGFLILRILGSNYYDYVSYAAGFTNLKDKVYFAITIPTSLVWTFILYYLIDKAINFNEVIYLVVIGTVYVASLYLGYEAWKRIQAKSK
jgi:uncharacterized membrane protein YdjX (TVP38/TMEM64 family)